MFESALQLVVLYQLGASDRHSHSEAGTFLPVQSDLFIPCACLAPTLHSNRSFGDLRITFEIGRIIELPTVHQFIESIGRYSLTNHRLVYITMLSRTITSRASAQRMFARCLTGSGPIPIDVDHFVSGWNIGDIEDFTKSGHYNVQTYDKISPAVSTWYCWGCCMYSEVA